MNLEPEHCYRALLTHDARFDGRFFVGVSSTGIYCRPVCRVRTPKAANCTFYPSAAAAEQAGFRPCLRCRPERAPAALGYHAAAMGPASVDASSRLAHIAAHHIDSGFLEEHSLDDLARQLGISERHLRRVFAAEFGVAPVQHAQTQKLLLARRLLHDTALPVTDIAYAAGFGSTRRLHTLFQKHYGVAPGAWRRGNPSDTTSDDTIAIELAYRPPYAWQAQLDFLAGRAIAGVEAIIDGRYVRAVRIARDQKVYGGWISVEHAPTPPGALARNSLVVRISASLTPVIAPICAKVRHLFDLGCDPQAVADALGPLAAATPGLRVPGAFDGFEMAVRAILGQQISVAAARTLAGRIAAKFGTAIDTPFAEITQVFPSAAEWPQDASALSGIGLTGARIDSLIALAQHCVDGLLLEPSADIDNALIELQNIRGIGEWTAHYIAMRALAWPDAFPHTDYVVKKVLNETNPKRVLALAEPWRPWRAYATRHLWHSVSVTPAAVKETIE
jgi:AraC family transcriptional regulator of adaptative response / DNA-3-methyladenine glycosylase II